MTLKILRLIGSIGEKSYVGPAKMAFVLSRELVKKGIKNVIYTCYVEGIPENSEKLEIMIFEPIIEIGNYRINPVMAKHLLHESDADILHAHGYRNFETDIATLLNMINGIPLVITSHGTITSSTYLPLSTLSLLPEIMYDLITMRTSLRKADAIVATTRQEAKEVIETGIPPYKVHIIPHGLQLPNHTKGKRRENQKDPIKLLIVSRLTYKNNIELAIKGFSEAYKRSQKLRLVIVGDEKPSKYVGEERGYRLRLIKLCRELGVEDKVTFTGWITGDGLWEAYRNSHIFIWTSRYDNFGHALVEAAHFGLPIISTPVGVAPEIVGKGEGGVLIRQEDVEGLAQAISTLAENPQLRRHMGKHNMQQAKEYTVDRMVKLYVRLYRKLTG